MCLKNNLEKFTERFSWKLTNEENKVFLVENFDQKIERRGGRYKEPRVFTEQGIAILATILKSKIAIEVSIRIYDAYSKILDKKVFYRGSSLNHAGSKTFSINILEDEMVTRSLLEKIRI